MHEQTVTIQHGRLGRIIDAAGKTVLMFERVSDNGRALRFYLRPGDRVAIDPLPDSAVNCTARPAEGGCPS